MAPDIHRSSPSAWRPALAFLALATMIATAGYVAFQKAKWAIKEERQLELAAVANLKVGQITQWLTERRSDGEDVAYSLLLTADIEGWLKRGGPADQEKTKLITRLKSQEKTSGFDAALLLDDKGHTRLSTPGAAPAATHEIPFALEAMRRGKAIMSDVHWHNGNLEMDLVVPLLTSHGANRAIGALYLRLDPERFLFPLVRTWPVRSASAETYLVRREGDSAVLINPPRFPRGGITHGPLSLRLPIDSPKIPAAMAARGEQKVTEGTDYRGVPVVAALHAIPGTDWFMVAEQNRSEIYAPVHRLLLTVAALASGFILASGLIIGLWWHNLREHYRHEVDRRALMEHFDYLSKYANDIIFLADTSGRIIEANDRATEVYGYSREELLQRRIADFRPPEVPPALLKQQLAQVNEFGELRFETLSQRKDGSVFPIESTTRLIEVKGVKYLQGIIRDITARKQAEEEIEASHQRLRELTGFLETVREEERTRIAREVHDELGQVLTALKLNIGWLNAKLEEQDHPLAAKATTLGSIADQAIESARAVSAGLRPKMLDELGLVAALEWQADEFEKRTGIRCTIACLEEPTLDSNHASALFRMVQESLTNAARHSAATEVQIALRIRHRALLLQVRDNGRGFDPRAARKKKSFGLLGMSERALILGGRAKVRSALGKGTEVSVLVPMAFPAA